ncbi:MAG: zinc ribbon domain-containing protein [Gemmatimonadales bacterium]|nr:zinc ribbon domain-containing protein [Gemmatimonadales bacterium]NIN12947.1 zinc ribbon domain-containing protein [Gemmatimonadales bacterium]NIR02622.1 zinc ribbon domain-containing protein [Gemmatimonadales bacterium]NIS67198.1 zinc ribbon domain-containing protein [Gemmatimonadales bacterium]
MPQYDYVCQDCGAQFEVRLSISDYSDNPLRPCTSCGSEKTVRVFSGFNVVTSRSGGDNPSSGCGPACGPGCCA